MDFREMAIAAPPRAAAGVVRELDPNCPKILR
jgi:hypothetical protein